MSNSFFVLYRDNITKDTIAPAKSARGVAIHTPAKPKMRGNNNRQITKNTNVLKKDSIADNLPLDKAVKNAVVKTPIPLKRKLKENNLKPFKAILYASFLQEHINSLLMAHPQNK